MLMLKVALRVSKPRSFLGSFFEVERGAKELRAQVAELLVEGFLQPALRWVSLSGGPFRPSARSYRDLTWVYIIVGLQAVREQHK